MDKNSESAKPRLVEAQRFLLSQTKEFIVNTWLLEFLEREKADSFYTKSGSVCGVCQSEAI